MDFDYAGSLLDDLEMVHVLPNLLYLRELWLLQVPHDVDYFMYALRKNSSLHEVCFGDNVDLDRLEDIAHLLEAFGQRNANLPAMLVDFQQLESNGMYTSSLEDSVVSLLPELLFVSLQMPRVAPTYMLSALLASHAKVGPTRRTSDAL
jgi:hypothetical protein